MSEVPLTAHSVLHVPLLHPRPAGWPVTVADRPVALLKPLLGHAMGLGYIADVVEKQEKTDPAPSPVSRRVVLLVEPSLQQVAQTWSDPVTGAYRFDGLSMSARFTVVAYDHLRNWRAVIADGLAAKAVQP